MVRVGFSLVRPQEKAGDCEAFSEGNEDEDEPQQVCKNVRSYESSKKMYLLFFMSTTVVACFCIFVVIPQLIDYFTSSNAGLNAESSVFTSKKQSVIDLLDTERSRRNKERLEIMQKFDALQQNYKRLQIEYQKAQELYLKKLHNAYKYEAISETTLDNLEARTTKNPLDENELKIFDIENNLINGADEDKSEDEGIPYV